MRAPPPAVPTALVLPLLAAGLLACSEPAPRDDLSAAPDDVARLCHDITNTFECARRVERERFAAGSEVAHRSGDSLVLGVVGGPMALVDSLDEHGVGVRYSYQGHLPSLDWFLVHVQQYEGDGFLLINSGSGAEYPLDSRPLFSPGGGRLATANFDLEAGYTPNALRIFGVDADSVWVIWETEPADWGPVDARWASNTELRFTRRHLTEGGEYADTAAVLSFTGETWQIGSP